ncbi:MAG: sigma factor, partial [Bacteroidota bacterium]
MSLHIDPMLLAALKRGEEKAFSQLIDQYSQFVYAVAVRMLGDEVEARESSQEVFIKVWQKIDSYKSAYAFRTW